MPGFIPLESSDDYLLLDSDSENLLVQTDQLSVGFCVSSAEPNRLDKTAFLSEMEWIAGTLRDESSVVNPTLIIEHATFPAWNYAYIPAFNRYYFIAEITSVRTGLWRISFRVDVLMSYKETIGETYAMVDRNEHSYDPYLFDDLYPPRYNKEVSEYTVFNVAGFTPTIRFKTDVDLVETPHIAVTSINTQRQNVNEDSASPDPAYLPAIKGNNFVNGLRLMTYALDSTDLSALTRDLITNSSHASYILSVIAFPYELDSSGSLDLMNLYVGNDTVKTAGNTPIKVQSLKNPFISYAVLNDFMMDASEDFLDFEPYKVRELYVPFCGWYKIPYEVCAGHEILVYYSIDQIMGAATAYVYDKTAHRLLWSSPCQLGTKLPVNTTNALENKKTEDSNNLNLIMSLVGSAASIGIGAATSNPIAVAGGVLAGANGIASYIDKANHIIDRAQATAANATTAMSSPQKCRMRVTRFYSSEYDEAFAHQFGKPLRRVRRLSSLTGHTVVSSIHLEIAGAYPAEVNAIESILKEGFIA